MTRSFRALSLAASLASAAVLTAPSPVLASEVGRILHYVRSNTDGTEAERVSVYQASPTEVAVYKMRSRCTNAALVTATFDPESRQATQLVGGRLARDGTQQAFAWLDHDPASNRLIVRLERPDAEPLEVSDLPGGAPWRLYDFDFADWNGVAARPIPGRDITFDMALAWPEPAEDGRILRVLGRGAARFMAAEDHGGLRTLRYRIEGEAFPDAQGGDLWLDAKDGTVVEARLGPPNHPGYDDFRLVRTGEARGEAAWRALLADHWTGCPPA